MALTDNLLAFYKLDNLTDSSGNGNTLTNNNGVTFSSGKIGNAANFDGAGQTLSFSNYTFGTNNLSFAAWFKPTIAGQFGSIWSNKNVSYGSGFYLLGSGDKTDGYMRFYLPQADTTHGGAAIVANDAVSFDVWNHVVLTRNETEIAMWINGAKQTIVISNYSGNFDTGVPDEHFFGNDYYDEYFGGQMDAIGIWNRALNSTEVAELYNSGNGLEEFGGAPATQSFIKIQDSAKFFGKVKFIS